MRASVAGTGPQFSLLEPFPHKQLIAYHGSKNGKEAFVNLLDKQEEKNTEDRTLELQVLLLPLELDVV